MIKTAISNVLARKRSERLGLQLKLERFLKAKEPPTRGLGSDIHCLDVEIKTLEEALIIASEGKTS